MTKERVRSTDGKLRLFYLPAYSPQLNPGEWAWQNVKDARIRTSAGERFTSTPIIRWLVRAGDSSATAS